MPSAKYAVLLVALTVAAACNAEDGMLGQWKWETFETCDGTDDMRDAECTLTFEDKHILVRHGRQQTEKHAYEIDTTKEPNTLDVHVRDNDGKEFVIPCIFQLKDDSLIICGLLWASRKDSPLPRPTELKPQAIPIPGSKRAKHETMALKLTRIKM
jgi:uncharacterized protein (TIGR03067 family)